MKQGIYGLKDGILTNFQKKAGGKKKCCHMSCPLPIWISALVLLTCSKLLCLHFVALSRSCFRSVFPFRAYQWP